MVKTSWLYSLRKEKLSEICGSLDLDTKGTVEDMRKAVTVLIATPDLSTEMNAKLTEMEAKYAPRMLQLPENTVRGASPKRQAQKHISCGAAMHRICKWSTSSRESSWSFCMVKQQFGTVITEEYEQGGRSSGRLDGIARNSRREYQLFFVDTSSKNLNEIIALGERFENIPAPTVAPLLRVTSDGASQDSNRSITVEAKIGDMSFNLVLLVVRRSVDHLTLGMDFLAKTGAVLTVAGNSLKLGSKNSTPTAPAAARGTRASAVPKISPTPDTMATSSSRHGQTKTLERTTAVRTARTTPLATGDKAAKAATARPDASELKHGTYERVVDATVKSARAFKELQSVTTREDTTIAITTSGKTNKNIKDKKSKAGKDSGNSFKNGLNSRAAVAPSPTAREI
uniref:Uncharacterized protein n=1 Tax=Glossina palpalis gambiensis TaxID=67801 RepID=A0A1B0C6E1_9MUSC